MNTKTYFKYNKFGLLNLNVLYFFIFTILFLFFTLSIKRNNFLFIKEYLRVCIEK